MRVGVIRGDLPGPVMIQDLEPVSTFDPAIEPVGQCRYLSRPSATNVASAMSTVPAAFESTSDMTFNVVLSGANNVLRLRLSSGGAYVAATIATATYTSMSTLLTAVNNALVAAGLAVTAVQGSTALRIRLQTSASLGVGAYVQVDTVGNGSTFNTPANFGAGGLTHTVPTAAAVITALNPVGGTLDVSSATQLTQVSPALSAAQVKLIADSIAPQFAETRKVQYSMEVGNLKLLLSSTFTPDVNRVPAFTPGSAVAVVQDDGVTAYAPVLPSISGAVHDSPNAGDITITGVGLGNVEYINETLVRVTGANGTVVRKFQKTIAATVSGGTTGTVTATSIVLPASLLSSLGVAGSKVQVQFGSQVSNVFTVT